jgi:prepilin-type processing-associated H-X9-DG protein
MKTSDRAVGNVPFISDTCGSGSAAGLNKPLGGTVGPDPMQDLSPNLGHFQNNEFHPVNLGYADGHVSSHKQSELRPVYYDNANYWFY